MSTHPIDTAKIAEAAFYIWLEEGQPQGRDFDHWLRAQEALSATAQPPAKRKAAAKPKAKAAAKSEDKPKAAKPRARKPAAKTKA